MANTADAVTGNATYGLRAYSLAVISVLLQSCGVLAALGLMNSNKADAVFDVGSPAQGIMLTGGEVTPVRKRDVTECAQFYPLIQSVDERDVKTMGYRDTSATIAVGAGASYTVTVSSGAITAVAVDNSGITTPYSGCAPTLVAVDAGYTGQGAILEATISGGIVTGVTVVSGGYGYSSSVSLVENSNKSAGEKASRPCFKWTHKETPGYVYERDLDRFKSLRQNQKQLFDQAVNELTGNEEKNMIAALLQYVNRDSIFGTPTTSTDDLWDSQYGLDAAIAADNTYAGIDRTLAANYWWRAQQDANARVFTLEQLWKDAHLTKGVAYLGGNVDVFMVGPTLFSKFMSEVQSYQINPMDDDKLKRLRQFGFQGTVIKHNTSYVMSDVRISPKTVYGLNAKSWIFATKSGKNFAFRGWENQAKIEGGKQAFYNTCDVQYMLICEAPRLNLRYTNVT